MAWRSRAPKPRSSCSSGGTPPATRRPSASWTTPRSWSSARREQLAEATVKVAVDGEVLHTAADGNGPVNALDTALRKALSAFYPELDSMHLVDYKVRIIDGAAATAARPGWSSPHQPGPSSGRPWALRPTSSPRPPWPSPIAGIRHLEDRRSLRRRDERGIETVVARSA
ncbi:MAG: alpha-isopropylmalate synthase regulatory domain-containing protein [Chloroflexota bacterium]